MPPTRVTLTLTLPQTANPESLPSPRDRFWNALISKVKQSLPFPPLPSTDYESALYLRFADELKRRVMERLGATPAADNLHLKLVQIRYGSALLDLDIYGLGAVLKALGVNEEFFVELLELYAPNALVASAFGPGATSAGTGLSAAVQSRDSREAFRASRLLQATSISLLVPVLLSLLICYVAFVEMHDEKVRYIDQNNILLDHYQSEIDSLSSRLRFEESRSAGTPIVVPGAYPGTASAGQIPAPPAAPHTGAWMVLGDVLLFGAIGALFLWGRNTWAKAAALLMAIGGAVTHEYVHVEIKSFEVKISDLLPHRGQQQGIHPPPVALSSVGPELLMQVQGFGLGSAALPEKETSAQVRHVCDEWQTHSRSGQDPGLLLVVGGTDVTRLTAARFESNFGLAQARAEGIKSQIVRCGVAESQVLAMVFGPQHTPGLVGRRAPKGGYPEDRRVQVWALWAAPLQPAAFAARAE